MSMNDVHCKEWRGCMLNRIKLNGGEKGCVNDEVQRLTFRKNCLFL